MKKVEKVSIGGYAFTFDVDAAVAADAYLKDMGAFYNNQEIVDGIEERMAELLNERVQQGGVVDKGILDQVISIIGRPERIAADEPYAPDPEKPARKLFRDMENARIAGVCSGLGAYFKFDPIILRIIFAVVTIVFTFGLFEISGVFSLIGPVAYAILWICIPPARTAQQRWALRGEDGTAEGIRRSVENGTGEGISRSVRNGAGEVGAALRQVGNSPAWSSLGRFLEVVFGLMLLLVAVSGLFAGALGLLGWQWLGLGEVIHEWIVEPIQEYPELSVIINTLWVKVLAIAVYALPFLGMLYGSIMMIFHMKSPSWHPGLIIFVLWLVAVVVFTILIIACLFSATAAV